MNGICKRGRKNKNKKKIVVHQTDEKECEIIFFFCLSAMIFPVASSMLIRPLNKMNISINHCVHIVHTSVWSGIHDRRRHRSVDRSSSSSYARQQWNTTKKKLAVILIWSNMGWYYYFMEIIEEKSKQREKKKIYGNSEKCNYIFQFVVRPFRIRSFYVLPRRTARHFQSFLLLFSFLFFVRWLFHSILILYQKYYKHIK